jgi:Hexameric tyrosine-coordinated heme protein (HTHP)
MRSHLRAAYEQDSAQLIASSQVIAVHFQTVGREQSLALDDGSESIGSP